MQLLKAFVYEKGFFTLVRESTVSDYYFKCAIRTFVVSFFMYRLNGW